LNCSFGNYASNLGGYNNTASGYVSSVLGGWGNSATGAYSATIGINACAYLWGQSALSSGQFSAIGDSQSSQLINRRSTTYTTGSTAILSLDGTGTANFIVPPSGKSWSIRVQYVARVTGITGTATGVNIGDTKTQTQEVGLKNIGGLNTILSGSPNSGIALEDASMNSASMSYSTPSNNLGMTFTAPTFTGGGTLTIKVVALVTLTEVS
jgi:hypothetical protein